MAQPLSYIEMVVTVMQLALSTWAQSDKLGTIDFYGNNDAGTPEKN